MADSAWKATLRSRLRTYRRRLVFLVWTVLTVVIVGYVYVRVAPSLGGGGVPFVRIGWVSLLIGWLALTAWSRRPWAALAGALLVGVAAFSVALGCPGLACTGPRKWHVFFELRPLGPTVSAAYDSGRCVSICPHRVQLVPLVVGYLAVGDTVAIGREPRSGAVDAIRRGLDFSAITLALVLIGIATLDFVRGMAFSFIGSGSVLLGAMLLVAATLDLHWSE